MGTVTIGSNTYNVYGTQADAVVYLSASLKDAAKAWIAATAATQAASLVEVARMLNRQSWAGAVTVDGQALAWPRQNVTVGGVAVDSATVPGNVMLASYELAAAVLADPTIVDKTDETQNIASLQAGSVSISYFRPTPGARFANVVQELLAPYLSGSTSTRTRGFASTADDTSAFDALDNYTVAGPL